MDAVDLAVVDALAAMEIAAHARVKARCPVGAALAAMEIAAVTVIVAAMEIAAHVPAVVTVIAVVAMVAASVAQWVRVALVARRTVVPQADPVAITALGARLIAAGNTC